MSMIKKPKVLVLIKGAVILENCSIPAENHTQASRRLVEVNEGEMLRQDCSLGCLLYPKQYYNLEGRRL